MPQTYLLLQTCDLKINRCIYCMILRKKWLLILWHLYTASWCAVWCIVQMWCTQISILRIYILMCVVFQAWVLSFNQTWQEIEPISFQNVLMSRLPKYITTIYIPSTKEKSKVVSICIWKLCEMLFFHSFEGLKMTWWPLAIQSL